jgi:signal transduction histidine kinase
VEGTVPAARGPQAAALVRAAARWLCRCAALAGLALAGLLLVMVPVAAVVVPSVWPVVLLNGGLISVFLWGWLFPGVLLAVRGGRAVTERYRRLSGRWYGVPIESPYLPRPKLERTGHGWYWNGYDYHKYRWISVWQQSVRVRYRDPSTWRDLLWSLLAPVSIWLVALPPLLVVAGVVGLLAPLDPAPAGWRWLGVPVGLALLVAAVPLARWLPAGHVRVSRALLGPTAKARLRARVRQLSDSRTDATNAEAAELRRIERDLHDGAQARLVAVGMTLGAIERLLDTDPAAAKELLAKTRETSQQALRELRDLVRGIHPPVLSERGLGDAVRALCLDIQLPIEVRVQLPGRPEPPVESAAYFAVGEAVTNAAKHAGATRAIVDIGYRRGRLGLVVHDNGVGGADPDHGSGLQGIRRRLGTFDGTLSVSSPPGGPTTIAMEIPCALSSPRTSTSSETA